MGGSSWVNAHPGYLGAALAVELFGRPDLEPAEHRVEEDASVLVFYFHISYDYEVERVCFKF